MKKIMISLLCLFSVGAFADELWNKALNVYKTQLVNQPKKAYLLLESGVPGKPASATEIWEEYKYEGDNSFKRVLKVAKNRVETTLPPEAKEKWNPVKKKEQVKKNEYKGLVEIFMADKQQNLKYRPTGKSKSLRGKVCKEYSFELTKSHKKKRDISIGKAYLEKETGAPCEIRRHNTSKFMKGTPDSFIIFGYDGKKLYVSHLEAIMNISFFGKSKNLKTVAKMEY